MAAPRFSGDPLTGYGTFTDPTGNQLDGRLSDFFGGRFYISNGYFIDTLSPMNPLRIGQQGPFSLTGLRGDNFSLTSQTLQGALNRGFGTHEVTTKSGEVVTVPNEFMRMVSGTVAIKLGDEVVGRFPVDVRPVTGIGRQWVAYQPGRGPEDFRTVRGPFNSTAELQTALGPRYRLATGEEAAQRALFSMLLAENRPLLDALIRSRAIDLSGADPDLNYGYGPLFDMLEFEEYESYTSSIIKTPGS